MQKIRQELVETGKFGSDTVFATQESKREEAEEYVREHPEASNREIASETSVSRTTAGKIKKELEEPSSEPPETHEKSSESDPEPYDDPEPSKEEIHRGI